MREQWETYQSAVIPPEAPPVQLKESRRAFYAGAQALLGVVLNMLSPGLDVADEDVAKMTELDLELREFVEQIKRGVV